MLLDKLVNCDRYAAVHPGLKPGFDFLLQPDISDLEDGRYVIDGDRLLAIVARGTGRGLASSPLEFHRRYIDIQYVVAGGDVMGWSPLADCKNLRSAYDEATDLGFYHDHPATWCTVPAGCMAVFFPEDAHAPLAGASQIHKVVMKVAVDAALWR